MVGEINFGAVDYNMPVKVANAFSTIPQQYFAGQDMAAERMDKAQARQMNAFAMQKAQQAMIDEQEQRNIYRKSGGDLKALQQELLASGHGKEAMGVAKQLQEQEKNQISMTKDQLDVAKSKVNLVGNTFYGLAQSVQPIDENTIAQVLGSLKQQGIDTTGIEQEYAQSNSPMEFVQHAMAKSEDAMKRLEAHEQRIQQQTNWEESRRDRQATHDESMGLRRDMLTLAQDKKGEATIPQGYRPTPEGNLAPIPGGPADIKIQEKASAAKAAEESVGVAIDSIEELIAHPGMSAATGKSSITNALAIPGGAANDFLKKLDTFKSQMFVPMVRQMKGMGQLSDAEGKKLTQAVGALDPSMSEESLKAELNKILLRLQQPPAKQNTGTPLNTESAHQPVKFLGFE